MQSARAEAHLVLNPFVKLWFGSHVLNDSLHYIASQRAANLLLQAGRKRIFLIARAAGVNHFPAGVKDQITFSSELQF